jgi:thiamine-phosphate pyrophosphorylase
MLVTDRRVAGGEDALVRKVAEAVAGGVNVVQLREKDLDTEALVTLAQRIKDAIHGRALLIINTSAEAAANVGADGLHLPEDVPFERPSGMLVGRSVHSAAAARRAEAEGADYLVFGPVFETETHPGVRPAGLDELGEAAAGPVPVVAIGGVTAEGLLAVMAAGVAGVAVIRAVLEAESPGEAARRLATEIVQKTSRFAVGGPRARE